MGWRARSMCESESTRVFVRSGILVRKIGCFEIDLSREKKALGLDVILEGLNLRFDCRKEEERIEEVRKAEETNEGNLASSFLQQDALNHKLAVLKADLQIIRKNYEKANQSLKKSKLIDKEIEQEESRYSLLNTKFEDQLNA